MKYFLLILLFPLFCSAQPSYNGAHNSVVPSGLMSWWTFNPDDITSGTNAVDRTGSNHAAFLIQAPLLTNGILKTALNFNGSNQSVHYTNSIVGNLTAFTISAWFNTTGSVASYVIYGEGSSSSINAEVFIDVLSSGKISGGIRDDSSAGNIAITSVGTFNDGKWHLAQFVQTSKSARSIYIDGVSVATDTTTITTLTINQAAIGSLWRTTDAAFWLGMIDNVKLYNRALSPAELSTLYTEGINNTLNPSAPNTYFVSTSGSDSNDGKSTNTPFLTVGKINSTAINIGDSVYFNGGNTFTDATLVVSTGQGNAPVIYGSYGTGRAILAPGSNTVIFGTNVSFCTIRDLVLSNTLPALTDTNSIIDGVFLKVTTTNGTRYNGLVLTNLEVIGGMFSLTVRTIATNGIDGYDGAIIANCFVHDARSHGITFYGGVNTAHIHYHSNCIVYGCVVSNITGNSSTIQSSGIGVVMGNSWGAHVYGNYITNCGASTANFGGGPGGYYPYYSEACLFESNVVCGIRATFGIDGVGMGFDTQTYMNTNQYNYVYNCDGAGFYCITSGTNVARFNLLVNNSKVLGEGERLDNNIIFYGNTVVQNNSGQPAFRVANGGGTLYNNIFYSRNGVGGLSIVSGTVMDGNLYFSGSGAAFQVTYNGVSYVSITVFRTATSQENFGSVARGFAADPVLNAYTSMNITNASQFSSLTNYFPKSVSPAVSAGLDLQTLFSVNPGTQDINGAALNVPYNIGAINTTLN